MDRTKQLPRSIYILYDLRMEILFLIYLAQTQHGMEGLYV